MRLEGGSFRVQSYGEANYDGGRSQVSIRAELSQETEVVSTDRTFEKTDGKKNRASGQEERQCEDEAALWAAPESHTDHRGLRGQRTTWAEVSHT